MAKWPIKNVSNVESVGSGAGGEYRRRRIIKQSNKLIARKMREKRISSGSSSSGIGNCNMQKAKK